MEAFKLVEFDSMLKALEQSQKMNFLELLAIMSIVAQAALAVLGDDLNTAIERNFNPPEIEAIFRRASKETIKLRGDTYNDVCDQIELTTKELDVIKKAVSGIAVIIFVENYKHELMALN